MPQNLQLAVFVFGAVLILIAVLGGGFKIFGAEIRGRVGRTWRIISGFGGLFFLVVLFLGVPIQKMIGNIYIYLVSPKVIATNPRNGATDVDPSLSEIKVTFSKPMEKNTRSFSTPNSGSELTWMDKFFYINNDRTCVQQVRLKPGITYVIWINDPKHIGFKDKSGNALQPYKLEFTTRQ